MVKFAIFLALIILLSIFLIYKDYKINKDLYSTSKKVFLLLILVAFTIFSKFLLIYLPIFILHIVLLFIGWGGYFLLLLNRVKKVWPIFLPLISILLFFITAIYVSKFD